MNVRELIAFLQKQPPDLPVAFMCYSENCLLVEEDIKVAQLSVPRGDGWVPNLRPDKASQFYLLFPGN